MASEQQKQLGSSLDDIHMDLSRAFHLMSAAVRPAARELGLGPGQPRILSYLAVHGVSTQREIADYFLIDPSAVSRMLDSLEKGGFLENVPGRDRRSRALELTKLGYKTVRAWDTECARVDEVIFKGFSQGERSSLERLLGRAHANLSENLSEREGGNGRA